MSSSKSAVVAEAVEAIRDLHSLGLRIGAKPSHRAAYKRGLIDAAAAEEKVNPDTLRKARQFGDPVEGYTVREVEDLCRLITEIQSHQADDCAVFGRTHVIRILSVKKSARTTLTKAAISGGWSTRELGDAIAARFGTRRDGGRKGRVPKDATGLLVQLEKLCEGWRRWLALVHPDRPRQEPKPKASAWDDVSPEIQRQVGRTDTTVANLHKAVVQELRVLRPKRNLRHQFRSEER